MDEKLDKAMDYFYNHFDLNRYPVEDYEKEVQDMVVLMFTNRFIPNYHDFESYDHYEVIYKEFMKIYNNS